MGKMEKEINIMLLTYPRSGSNFLGYIIENVFKIKMNGIAGHTLGYKNAIKFKKGISINVIHYSSGNHVTELNETYETTYKREILKQDGLLVLCRNYIDCISSQKRRSPRQISELDFFKEASFMYVNNLVDFEKFEKEKAIVYYEDLITNIQSIIDKIIELLNKIDSNILKDFDYEKNVISFLKSITAHKKISENFYKQGPGGQQIFRNKNRNINSETIRRFDDIIKNRNNIIFSKYLKKYKTI